VQVCSTGLIGLLNDRGALLSGVRNALDGLSAEGGADAAAAAVGRVGVFTLAESLGGVESLIGYPARMSHASLAGTPQAADPGLIRLSVGIEDIDDLLADLAQALA